MKIKIVGAIADHDEVDTIKKVTEIFVIERRIKGLFIPNEFEK